MVTSYVYMYLSIEVFLVLRICVSSNCLKHVQVVLHKIKLNKTLLSTYFRYSL
jgi:hypothetical protein